MGMFDTVRASCPNCGRQHEIQSKAGACELKEYRHTSVPVEIALSLRGEAFECCGVKWTFDFPLPRRVQLTVREVEEDDEVPR